jgi:D-alanyl-D-alanine carboxypeptidase/D-alanyl-D-alanine-endopeptidase (penicillin-binding protein 4)
MLSCRTLFGLLVACIALLSAAPAHALDRAAVRAKLARETAKLGAASGAHVVDLDAGTVLFSRRPDLALVPASNQKLFVTATALLTLGADARRETIVAGDAVALSDPKAIATRNLYVVGAGDPSLANADLASLADQLVRQSGLTRVAGGVVGDESLLDARRGSVDSSFKPDFNLGGQLGALVVGHGTTDRVGPAHLVAARLQAMLKARGVRFGRRARTGRAPADAEELATDRSPPLSDLVRATNQPSDNFYAELLLKVVGAEEGDAGTTAAGAAVVRRRLAQLGLRPTISDGSGLSRGNRTNARQVVTLLRAMRRGVTSAAWLGSLTVAGRNGTLRRRLRGTAAAGRCSGKTGTLRGVSALSGYCTTTTGRHVVFSFLENGIGPGAKSVEDRMVAALARYEG